MPHKKPPVLAGGHDKLPTAVPKVLPAGENAAIVGCSKHRSDEVERPTAGCMTGTLSGSLAGPFLIRINNPDAPQGNLMQRSITGPGAGQGA